MAKLAELGTIITGNTPKTADAQNYATNDICFVKPSDIADGEVNHLSNTEFYISEYARPKARIIPPNSVLVTCIGIVGKVAINEVECAFNQQINAIVPETAKCIPEYIAFALQSKQMMMQDIANAAVVPILNKAQFSEICIQVPSLEEQQVIVDKMNKISKLIFLRKEQLAKLDELVKARFVELFGDPMINPMGWPTKALLDMGYCKNGMNFHTGDSGIEMPCLGVGDFKDFSVIDGTDYLPKISLNEAPPEEYLLRNGDLVFVRSNGNKALVGRCLIVYPHNTPTTYSGFCIRYRITSNDVKAPYLVRVLKTDSMRKKMAGRGANIQNLNQQILASLNIPVPPMELQNQFVDFIDQTNKTKLTIQASLDKLEVMKKALMQEYFG